MQGIMNGLRGKHMNSIYLLHQNREEIAEMLNPARKNMTQAAKITAGMEQKRKEKAPKKQGMLSNIWKKKE